MKKFINYSKFKEIFKINSEQVFMLFNDKLLDEFNKNFHKNMNINDLSVHSAWSDANKHRRAVLKGNVSFGPENSTIHGEIVWLEKLNIFRVHLKHFFC